MTIGSELQQAREQRGLTLVQISERTKIRVPVLRAIERDDFKQLPGGVIARGFVRLFAREVGLDENAIGARFTAQLEPTGVDPSGEGSPGHGGADAAHGSGRVTGTSSGRAVGFALAALALIAVAYFVSRPGPAAPSGANAGGQPAASAGPVAVGTSSASGSDAPPGTTPSSPAAVTPEAAKPVAPPEPAPAAKDTSALRVDLHATDACWISVTADGEQVAFRSLSPGERLAVRATNEIVLRIGIPANLVVSINGQRMPPSARPGTPVTLRITPANYRDLLKP
jgi:cytoskeletal protein RodZ